MAADYVFAFFLTSAISLFSQGFRFDFFINWNSFFSFVMAILLLVMIREAEALSRKILAEEKQNGA